jgi:hypothetical protein
LRFARFDFNACFKRWSRCSAPDPDPEALSFCVMALAYNIKENASSFDLRGR